VLTGADLHFSLGGLDAIIKGPQSADVTLTINSVAQDAAMQALGNRTGSVVVLDVKTGAVVAMYSNPTYDPNLLAVHDTNALKNLFGALINAPTNPLRPRAYRERYPSGSTFKVITTAIALGAGIVTPTTPLFPSVTQIPLPLTKPVRFLNNFGSPPERCGGTLEESFTVSCNTTFAALGLQLQDRLATGAQTFGLNEAAPPLDLDPSAVQSIGPKPGTFKQTQPQFALAAIGQGDVAVTPLQMALVAESVATGGQMLVPYVVQDVRRSADKSLVRSTKSRVWRTVMDAGVASTITGFMLNVVNSPNGTGTAAQIPGVQVAGKTGTAQTVKGAAPHAWFVAFAPAEAPRYAIAVIVEHGGELASEATGGKVAAPIARAVLAKLLGVG
jgi:peptidoglycan glycosyltransferase